MRSSSWPIASSSSLEKENSPGILSQGSRSRWVVSFFSHPCLRGLNSVFRLVLPLLLPSSKVSWILIYSNEPSAFHEA